MDPERLANFLDALEDFNIEIKTDELVFEKIQEPSMWDWVDDSFSNPTTTSSALSDMQNIPPLAFPVRYQLEVCISQGILNEHNIDRAFVEKLLVMDERQATELLEHLTSKERHIYDPMSIFSIKVSRGTHTKARIPQYCVYSRKTTVTPTMVYYSTPAIEISNRVIRHYSAQADRFLRVQFTDEKTEASHSMLSSFRFLTQVREISMGRTSQPRTRSSQESSGQWSTGSKLGIDISSFWHLAIPNFENAEPTFSPQYPQ
jgi:RNA-dependent RNA polymerase